MAEVKRILSIDGGGIRGVIPAMVLAHIEEKTGKNIADLFDLVVGTSTGGILALALTISGNGGRPRYSASDVVDLYEREGAAIFHRGPWHQLTAIGNIIEEKYPATGIERVLQEYFGESRLSEAVKDVMVTSYEIERRQPYFFKSYVAKREAERDFLIWEVARATSAAPTYFEPARLARAGSRDYLALIDGGVFANNPGLCAYVEAYDLYDTKDFLVVSLGTGELTRPIPYEEAKGWGLAMWAQPLLGAVFDGASDSVSYHLNILCKKAEGDQSYFRFQPYLIFGNDDMDDASQSNIRNLRLLAEELIKERGSDLNDLCSQLSV